MLLSNQMASRLTITTSFPRVFFQLLWSSRQHPSLSANRAAAMTKTDLIFPAFSSRFVDFAVFIQREVTHESGLTVTQFFSTNHNSLLRIATNEIASFRIDHRSCQMALFCAKAGQKAGFRIMLKYFEIKTKAFCYYIKQIDSMSQFVWFSNRSQKTSKCGKNISDTLG